LPSQDVEKTTDIEQERLSRVRLRVVTVGGEGMETVVSVA